MNEKISSIWKAADLMRGSGERVSIFNLVTKLKELGIPVDVDDLHEIIMRIGLHSAEYYVPRGLPAFIAKLLDQESHDTLLDPWAGMGMMAIPLNAILQPKNFVTITPSTDAHEIYQMLEGSTGIEIQCGDPLTFLTKHVEKYDCVVGVTPFGLRSRGPVTVRIGDKDQSISDDYGNQLILQSCLRLLENGTGVFIVPNSFFFKSAGKGKAINALNELGFNVTAAIELPAGAFQPLTSITTHIIIVQKASDLKLFTAKYLPDNKHQQELLKHLRSRTEGKSLSTGRLFLRDKFQGYTKIEFSEKLQEQSQRMGLKPYSFKQVVLELNTSTSSSDFVPFPEKPNAVYLPLMAATNATTSQESLPERLKSYFQIVINPDVANAEFVAGLMNTNFGQLWRDVLRTGTTIPRISKASLENAIFYLPPDGLREIQRKVVECHDAINILKNDLKEIETTLWTHPKDIDKVIVALHAVNREDRFEDWLETLPFPLASILWVCHTQGGGNREQYERKIHFFEALAEFLSVLYLSAFIRKPAIWTPIKEKLNSVLTKQSLSLERATFGTWKVIVEVFSAETRRLLNDDTEWCLELYKTRNRSLIESISSKSLVSIIESANSLRNDWMGHVGAIRENDSIAVNNKMDSHIRNVREIFGMCWEHYELFLPGRCTVKDGLYHYNSKKLMGSRTPFPSETLELIEAMEDGQLHIKSPDEQQALILLPLVKIMSSPRTEENACYFYNRQQKGKIRFLSYYFESDPEIVQDFPDTEDVLRNMI